MNKATQALRRHRALRPARGFGAVAAIIILVLLAALGGFMLTFSNSQQLGAAQDIQGTRAYWAARAGLEWGLQAVRAATPAACPASPTDLVVEAFAVRVTCTPRAYVESGANVKIFQFTAVASAGGAPGSVAYIERSVSASMEQ